MIDNKIILKTTPEGEAVRSTEISSISIDLNNNAIAYNEQEIVVDLNGEEIRFPNTQSRFSVNFSEGSGTDAVKAARAQEAGQAIFNILKQYHLDCVEAEQGGVNE